MRNRGQLIVWLVQEQQGLDREAGPAPGPRSRYEHAPRGPTQGQRQMPGDSLGRSSRALFPRAGPAQPASQVDSRGGLGGEQVQQLALRYVAATSVAGPVFA